jgi:hypothetical protein
LPHLECAADAPVPPEREWRVTGHAISVLSTSICYRFNDHTMETRPGDMRQIPLGLAHPRELGLAADETARLASTDFD